MTASALSRLPGAVGRLPVRFLLSLCGTGLWLGTLFFAA